MKGYPDVRLRRLRKSAPIRRLFGQVFPAPERFIWPVFVVDGNKKEIPIQSMPMQSRWSVDNLPRILEPIAKNGIGGVILFGVADEENKNKSGSYSYYDHAPVQEAIKLIKREYPDMVIITDVCLCAYTDHGHCGLLDDRSSVDNDESLEVLARAAVSHAEAGADIVAPSAMMDGQVAALRHALNLARFKDTMIMSYSTKMRSSFYGPFRDAADSAPSFGDRSSYQAPYNDPRQAIRESMFDQEEGADMLMVKPAVCYLDILSRLREKTELPIAAYNVSGEYSMLWAAAEKGYGNLHHMAREMLSAIFRAGADIVLSYWANQYETLVRSALI